MQIWICCIIIPCSRDLFEITYLFAWLTYGGQNKMTDILQTQIAKCIFLNRCLILIQISNEAPGTRGWTWNICNRIFPILQNPFNQECPILAAIILLAFISHPHEADCVDMKCFSPTNTKTSIFILSLFSWIQISECQRYLFWVLAYFVVVLRKQTCWNRLLEAHRISLCACRPCPPQP